MHLDLPCFDET